MQDHFYHLRPNYGILFLPKLQPLDQGPASVRRLIAFWVLLRQQLQSNFLSLLLMPSYAMSRNKKKVPPVWADDRVIFSGNFTSLEVLLNLMESTRKCCSNSADEHSSVYHCRLWGLLVCTPEINEPFFPHGDSHTVWSKCGRGSIVFKQLSLDSWYMVEERATVCPQLKHVNTKLLHTI